MLIGIVRLVVCYFCLQSYEKTRAKQKKLISFFCRVPGKFATKWQSFCQRQATLGVERRKNERNAKGKRAFLL